MKAGSSGGWGTTKDQMRPCPDMSFHSDPVDWHHGHMGRGGNRSRPQAVQAWMRSSPCEHASQKGAESVVTAGRGAPSIMVMASPATGRWSARLRRW